MRVLVTGGAGFIGANFLNTFVPRFPEIQFINVDCLTYAANPDNLKTIENASNYAFERIDLVEAAAVQDSVIRHRPTHVVHFAAESHVDRSIHAPQPFVRTNVEGTLNLLQACRQAWPDNSGIFHHISTDEVFGSLGPTGYFTETSPYNPSSPYAASKAASDHLVKTFARTYGMRVRITHSSNNYGPLQFPEKLIPLMVLSCLEKRQLPIYGDGSNVRDWLHVSDHGEAVWRVLTDGRDGESYCIGSGAERDNLHLVRQICSIVAELTGQAPRQFTDLIEFVQDRPGHDSRYATRAEKIEKELGWRPRVTFDEGLRATIRWYLDNEAWVERIRSGEYRRWLEQNYAGRGKTA